MEARHPSDIVIVGAGITGLSAAFHLAERGAGRIVVLDRAGIGAGASGVQPGGVRQQWGTRVNVLLAQRSLAFYRQLGERLAPRVDPGLRACGYAFLAHRAETLERLRAEVALQNALGVGSVLLAPGELADVVPGLQVDGLLGGTFCPEDGYFDRPQTVVESFAEAAQRLGAEIARAEVTALERRRGGWRLRTGEGAVEAGAVVVAAAADTPALLRPLGIELPIEPERRFLFLSEPVGERLLEPLVVAADRRFAAKQLGDGRLLASDLAAAGDPARERERWRRRIRACIEELLPRLEFVPLPLLVDGIYDTTPDRQAIVGPVPGHDGLYVAAGFSGHGFMMAPEVGRGLAAMVAGEDPGEPFSDLRPERFDGGRLEPEPLVV